MIEIYSPTFAKHGYPALPQYREPKERVAVDRDAYPLLMTSMKSAAYTHGSYRSIPSLRRQVPEPYLRIHPDTAVNRDVEDGLWVSLETGQGAIRLRSRFDPDLHPEVVVGEEGWWQACPELGLPGYDPLSEEGANLNFILGDGVIDPLSGSVALRGQPCEIRLLDR